MVAARGSRMDSAGSRQRGLRGSATGTHAHSWPAVAQTEDVVRVNQVKPGNQVTLTILRPHSD
jgi:hypothetical protein